MQIIYSVLCDIYQQVHVPFKTLGTNLHVPELKTSFAKRFIQSLKGSLQKYEKFNLGLKKAKVQLFT